MRIIVGAISVALMVLGVARAEDACRADVEKLCAGIPPGGGRTFSCLKTNEEKLTPACKDQVATVVKKVKEVGAACEGDIQEFCADKPKGAGQTMRCLAWNGPKLSMECQQVVQRVQEKMSGFKKACTDDAAKLCKGIPQGQGRVAACLKSKQAELTPDCQTLVQALWIPGSGPAPAATPAKATAGAAPAAAAAADAKPADAKDAKPADAKPADAKPAAPAPEKK